VLLLTAQSPHSEPTIRLVPDTLSDTRWLDKLRADQTKAMSGVSAFHDFLATECNRHSAIANRQSLAECRVQIGDCDCGKERWKIADRSVKYSIAATLQCNRQSSNRHLSAIATQRSPIGNRLPSAEFEYSIAAIRPMQSTILNRH